MLQYTADNIVKMWYIRWNL